MALNDLTLSGDAWGMNADFADASGCEELKAVPTGKEALYLTSLEISCVADITVTIGSGEGTGACETVLFGPFNFADTSGSPIVMYFEHPIKLEDDKSLTIDASGAGAVQVAAFGFSR